MATLCLYYAYTMPPSLLLRALGSINFLIIYFVKTLRAVTKTTSQEIHLTRLDLMNLCQRAFRYISPFQGLGGVWCAFDGLCPSLVYAALSGLGIALWFSFDGLCPPLVYVALSGLGMALWFLSMVFTHRWYMSPFQGL